MPTFNNGEGLDSVRTKINAAIEKVDGTSPITSADINGGTIDGTVIGGTTPAAITGTTISGTSFATTGDMTFGDNDKAIFGAGSDLQIYHDGANSYIDDAGTGLLRLRSNQIYLEKYTGEIMAALTADAGVNLRYDNNIKLETTSTGVDVTGNATFADNGKAIFGAGSDLQIYHNGNNSFIEDIGTGALYIRGSSEVRIQAYGATNEDMIRAVADGAVSIYHNNSAKLATTSTGVDVSGSITADGLTVNKGSDGANIVSLTGASAGRYLNVQSFTNSGAVGAGYDFNATSGQGAIRLSTTNLPRLFVGDNGDISFYEDTGTTAKFFWDASAERIGLGTTTPATDLHIVNSGAAQFLLQAGAADTAYLLMGDAADTNIGWIAYENANDAMSFRTNNAERMRITSSGSVGIGTSSPASALDVVGTITSDGLTVDGDITSTGGDLNLATLDLNAIAASKAVTAVDVFVYDTSKDSDGGAWRKRTQHTSWYNETLNTATRGSRREFPAVAVIVAESSKVTIYDGDDPALPMWMVFNNNLGAFLGSANAISSVAMKNAAMVSGHASGMAYANFLSEVQARYYTSYTVNTGVFPLSISQRGVSGAGLGQNLIPFIVNVIVNDVAMTVLPDAPIDPATGLQVPTIAVATDGGVSVIKDDGTVVDLTFGVDVSYSRAVCFTGDTKLAFAMDSNSSAAINRAIFVHGIPSADFTVANYSYNRGNADEKYITNVGGAWAADVVGISGDIRKLVANGPNIIVGNSFILRNPSDPTKSAISAIQTSYNTGWMNGDIKGAFLSDTDDTDLVGSGELVPSSFASWDINEPNDATVTESSGVITLTVNTTGNGYPRASAPITCVVGQTYCVSVSWANNTTGFWARVGTTANLSGTSIGTENDTAASGSATLTFVATATTHYLNIFAEQNDTGSVDVTIASQSVKLADADRSVNNNGLIVNGTVTRSAVATGAELVAYSGFSSSNYLEQPYNSALDFGTGDFCVMGWAKQNASGVEYFYDRGDGTTDTARIVIAHNNGQITLAVGQAAALSGHTIPDNVWTHLSLVRSNGTASLYVNGVNVYSASRPLTVSGNCFTRFGISQSGATPLTTGAMALWRISATVPTAEQIKKIYEDEKVLFQENAACTLYGTSDAVTALAHDSDTGLLHVGTSAGRSVFQGLRRVSNTTTAVGTAISASNGLVVEE